MPAGTCHPYGLAAAGRPLCRGPWPQPVTALQQTLATIGHPLVGGQAMAGRPSSSSLRLLQKRCKNA
ncbi:hypothetical protein BHE74_00045498 [Ensete ventricosum]|nr:hypothetical protein GW17_00049301 [Ensete ventricosum]RWW48429.1 hypothetical protein BHE74_00045498 [Ensete ventricosum]RZS13049.1 hypothetical protein BHM03_00044566 [Ensete ventricosum]